MDTPFSTLFADRPEFLDLQAQLRDELELGNHYLAGVAFVILEIDDTIRHRDAALMRERLLHRALVATERSIRQERGIKRKIVDFVFGIDRYLFISLGSVDAGTLRVPLSRIANQIRNEFYSTGDLQSLQLRRAVTIGVAHWLPEVGYIGEQTMIAKAWQAFQEAKAGTGRQDAYAFLGLAPSNLDTIALSVYDWGQSESVPVTSARPASKPNASVRPAVMVKTAPETKPKKKSWQFWK